jgi:hypothetical protein
MFFIQLIPRPCVAAQGRRFLAIFFGKTFAPALAPTSALCLALALLSGCATQPSLYRWGDYDTQVYAHFKNTGSVDQQIAAREKTLNTGNQVQNPGPGIYAHLGLLYAKQGRADLMRKSWEKEKALYPESAAYLDFLMHRNGQKLQGANK